MIGPGCPFQNVPHVVVLARQAGEGIGHTVALETRPQGLREINVILGATLARASPLAVHAQQLSSVRTDCLEHAPAGRMPPIVDNPQQALRPKLHERLNRIPRRTDAADCVDRRAADERPHR